MENQRKIWFDQNDQPPKNYIWYKNGQYLEWNGEKWVTSTGLNNGGSAISQDMTEAEKMESRKNLGLYYEETTVGEKTAQYDSSLPEVQLAPTGTFVKVSDDTPAKEDLISISFSGNTSTDFTFGNFDDGYSIIAGGIITTVRVVFDTSLGNEPGLYILAGALTYKGEITTVSKIDAKFLPEQGSGGMPVIKLLKMPPTTNPGFAVRVDITEYFSQEDADKLFNLESCFIVYNNDDGSGLSFVTTYGYISHAMMGDTYKGIHIKDNQENEYIFTSHDWGSTPDYSVQYNPKQTDTIDITQLPTNGMTQQELENIGITAGNLTLIRDGLKRGFKCNNYVYPIISVDVIDSYNLIIEFWTSTNKYVISADTTMYTILSCTVTPR